MKIKRFAILFCLLLFAVQILLSSCGNSFVVYPDADKYSVGNGEYEQPISFIEINWPSGDVTVEPYDGNTLQISESFPGKEPSEDVFRLHHYFDGKTLHVQFVGSGEGSLFGNIRKNLLVRYPKYVSDGYSDAKEAFENGVFQFESVKIASTSGKIVCDFSSVKELSLNQTSGEIECSVGFCQKQFIKMTSGNVYSKTRNAEIIEFDSSSGKTVFDINGSVGTIVGDSTSGNTVINAESGSVKDRISLSATSGDIRVINSGVNCSEMELKTTSGNIELLLGNPDCTLDVNITSGDFNSEFPLLKNGDVYLIGEGKAGYKLTTTSGNIDVLKR